jgi:transposase
MYYPYIMPSLITKWKKGKPYLYWVRSARINGQPRIAEQVYLGPRDQVMEQIHTHFTSSSEKPQLPVLQTVQIREFGASALLYSLAKELDLIELINTHVPQPDKKHRTSLSVGHYLVLSAINRAIWPQSKRAFAPWYYNTVLARLLPVPKQQLTSQRFWDHMNLLEQPHLAKIQQALLARISEHFPLKERLLIYDTTNSYTFIHTFNTRAHLPQRGRNKQKRQDLRQISLALVVDEQRGLPLYYRCYEGHIPDVVAFGSNLKDMIDPFLPPKTPPHLTLVLDKGNVSTNNLKALKQAHFSFIAAIPAGWVRSLYQIPVKTYQPLILPDGRRIKVYSHPKKTLLETHGKLLVRFSPRFYRKQVRTLDLLEHKAEQKLLALRATILQAREQGHPRKPQTLQRHIAKIVAPDRLKEFFCGVVVADENGVYDLSWKWQRDKKVQIKHRYFGRTVLFTDRQELTDPRIVMAYQSQAKVESLFRISKSRRPGLWWPAYHWTDPKLQVHALCCFLAMLLVRIVLHRLQQKNISIGVDFLTERLRGIQEALVVYSTGAAQRVITERSPEQEELFNALELAMLAQQLGNTVFNP